MKILIKYKVIKFIQIISIGICMAYYYQIDYLRNLPEPMLTLIFFTFIIVINKIY